MGRQTIGASDTDNDLSDLFRIAWLIAPIRFQLPDSFPNRGIVVRQHGRHASKRPLAPVGAHAAWFECRHFDSERCGFKSNGLGKATHGPLGSNVSSVPCQGRPPTDGRNLDDVTASLLAHPGKSGPREVHDTKEVGFHDTAKVAR
ncbi:hypothetical protein FQZ97_1081020 [compost metagenome]